MNGGCDGSRAGGTGSAIATTGAGLILHDAAGHQLAAKTIVQRPDGAVLITTGAWPDEVELSRDHLRHLERVFQRAATATLFPADAVARVPRREPDLPTVVSPMG